MCGFVFLLPSEYFLCVFKVLIYNISINIIFYQCKSGGPFDIIYCLCNGLSSTASTAVGVSPVFCSREIVTETRGVAAVVPPLASLSFMSWNLGIGTNFKLYDSVSISLSSNVSFLTGQQFFYVMFQLRI